MNPSSSPSAHRRATAASVIGNTIEWFDFLVYGFLSATVAKLFFPVDDPATAVLLGFATFAVSYVARPVGGIVFGIYADRHGRRSALAIIFGLMCFGTLMIAVLPTYESIGIAAPILLILSRLVQGFSAGGEFGNATTALIEFAPPERRGLYGSLQMLSQGLTTVFASLLVYVLSTTMDVSSFDAWGWRIPFMLGVLFGPVGLYLRLRMAESPEFAREVEKHPWRHPDPLGTVFRDHKVETLASVGIFASVTGGAFITAIYLPAMVMREIGLSRAEVSMSVLVVSVIATVIMPIAGHLSDWFDRLALVAFGAAASAICFVVLSCKLAISPSLLGLMLLQLCYAVPYAVVAGAAPTLVAEFFPVRARATGSSLSYNLAGMLFGGLSPLTVAGLATMTGSRYASMTYIVGISLITLASVAALAWKRKALAQEAWA